MSEQQKPPFSLAQHTSEAKRLTQLLDEQKKQKRQDSEVSFEDDFAPSSSPAKDDANSGILQTKAGRLHCYNDHVLDYMEGALDRACELGLPRIPWFFPLQYPPVSDFLFQVTSRMVGALSETLEEQSDDWLALKCYLCWLEACHALTDGASILYVADKMFVAGATAREFELSVRNRRHSDLGRRQNRHLTDLREGKNRRAALNVEARRKVVANLMEETRLTGGSLDIWLVKQLFERHSITIGQRTVRSDRKVITG
ncbi:hypothetical protein [Yoonia sp. MH D7]